MSNLKIYGVPLSRAYRALWMANELGLDYENIPIHFADGSAKTPEYLAVNPNGRIPAIDDNGFKLWESMAINLYLDGLLPKTMEDEAQAIQWSFWVMTEVEKPALAVLSWARMGGVDLSGFPHVDQWLAGCLKRPAAVKARPAPIAK